MSHLAVGTHGASGRYLGATRAQPSVPTSFLAVFCGKPRAVRQSFEVGLRGKTGFGSRLGNEFVCSQRPWLGHVAHTALTLLVAKLTERKLCQRRPTNHTISKVKSVCTCSMKRFSPFGSQEEWLMWLRFTLYIGSSGMLHREEW